MLLQAALRGMDVRVAEADISMLPSVAEAGHVHDWVLSDRSVVATVHVAPASGVDPLALPPLAATLLHERHATGQ